MSQIDLWGHSEHEALASLSTSRKGLSSSDAIERLSSFGRNETASEARRTTIEIFLSQFRNGLVIVLAIAAIVSLFLGEVIDALVIIAIVAMNAFLGFFQEHKAENALAEMKKYVSMRAKVMRDNEIREVDSKDLVPGDIVFMCIGDIVPADIRLLHSDAFTANESALTGESVPVPKGIATSPQSATAPHLIKNGAFMGTTVSSGEAFGVVLATGNNTFFGKSALVMKKPEQQSDFEKSISGFSIFLLKIVVFMTAFIFATNFFLGKGLLSSFIFSIAVAVGITPEILPMIITISLSHGALKLAKKNVVVRRLGAIEGLGNIDTLCCDKTGTLTEDNICLEQFVDVGGKSDSSVLVMAMVCNSAKMTKGNKLIGRGIDKAVLTSPEAEGLIEKADEHHIIDRNEFDFERRRMSVLCRIGNKKILIAKGAPDSVMSVSSFAVAKGKKKPLDRGLSEKLSAFVQNYEKQGFIVISVAEKQLDKSVSSKRDEHGLTLTGFLVFSDPPKKTAAEAIRHLQHIGVGIKILSGDSVEAAAKVCRDVGIEINGGKVVSGMELEATSPAEFEGYCMKFNVFARVSPEQKARIVRSLNTEGHIVGFLGDGINDAPALKEADVGISVDSGADVAKEAADIILLEKSLRVLGTGISEGRRTFGNIMKYVLNTVSANYGNMFTVAFSSLFLKFIPLLPSQILLNNFLSDFPMATVSTDNVDHEMLHKPKRWNLAFIRKFMYFFGIISSAFDLLLILSLIVFVQASEGLFRTAWFVFSLLTEILVLFTLRTRGFFYNSRPSNLLIVASAATAIAGIGITYLPIGNSLFSFEPMPISLLASIFALLSLYFLVTELAKHYFYHKLHAQM